MQPLHTNPFDEDKLKEECGVFGVIGAAEASNFVALWPACTSTSWPGSGGIVAYGKDQGFNSAPSFLAMCAIILLIKRC